jgi:hypothetical protein
MRRNKLVTLILGVVLPALMVQNALQANASPAKFGLKWQALLGEWKGENSSGGSAGACGFHLDLTDHIMVRTNHAVLAGDDASHAHDDLMIIYPTAQEDKGKAVYFDNEGHVIEYDADWSADGATLTFLSKPAAGPQFRLTYKREDARTFSVVFAMAPPGQESFKVYTSGKIKRE